MYVICSSSTQESTYEPAYPTLQYGNYLPHPQRLAHAVSPAREFGLAIIALTCYRFCTYPPFNASSKQGSQSTTLTATRDRGHQKKISR